MRQVCQDFPIWFSFFLLTNRRLQSNMRSFESGGSTFKRGLVQGIVYKVLPKHDSSGVVLSFMGWTTSPSTLIAWSSSAVGIRKISSFVFLDKGFYHARCADLDTMYFLVNTAWILGKGIFSYAMPGDPLFDPANTLMRFFLIWVTLKEMLVRLIPISLWLHPC